MEKNMSDVYDFLDAAGGLSGVASALGAGSGLIGTIVGAKQNKDNLRFQRENLDYQKRLQQKLFEREDTAYQRAVEDALKAGLSPAVINGGAGAGSVVSTSAPESNNALAINSLSQLGLAGGSFIDNLTKFSKMSSDKSSQEKAKADIQLAYDQLAEQSRQFDLHLEYMVQEGVLNREQAVILQNSQHAHEMNKLTEEFSNASKLATEKYGYDKKLLEQKLNQELEMFTKRLEQDIFEFDKEHSLNLDRFIQDFVAREQQYKISQGTLLLNNLQFELDRKVKNHQMDMAEAQFILQSCVAVFDATMDVTDQIQEKKSREAEHGKQFSFADAMQLGAMFASQMAN